MSDLKKPEELVSITRLQRKIAAVAGQQTVEKPIKLCNDFKVPILSMMEGSIVGTAVGTRSLIVVWIKPVLHKILYSGQERECRSLPTSSTLEMVNLNNEYDVAVVDEDK